ncbi:MAG: tetratricopeptide repeat protein [Proteobacteria bacterium]|nr:tetratricopeptide repeat protein [Pseudomonadota bacterium]MBU1709454.1 tetratricopeptide repeat protein [Pseudomonadota bacterium]
MNAIPDIDLNALNPHEFALFCGAGISWNSGLPLANDLVYEILGLLNLTSKDIELFKNAGYPFEAFMEILSKNSDLSSILDVFRLGVPNTNHRLIAKLAKLGYVKVVFTTNFDLLIERAFQEEGLREHVHYERFCEESDFQQKATSNIRLYKIHGSVDKSETIRTVIQQVARHTLSEKRGKALSYLFSSGEHKRVMVLGYSCSDFFDIIPEIIRIKTNLKDVLFIQQDANKMARNQWTTTEHISPFVVFPGTGLLCNTDRFVEYIWRCVYKSDSRIGEYVFSSSAENWKDHVFAWTRTISSSKEFVAGHLFSQVSLFDASQSFWENAIKVAMEQNDLETQAKCLLNIGNDRNKSSDILEAISNHKEAVELFKKLNDEQHTAMSYESLGNDYARLGKYKDSTNYFLESYRTALRLGNREMQSNCLVNVANSYIHVGEYEKCKTCLDDACAIAKDLGLLSLESDCYANFGNVSMRLREYERAVRYFEESLRIDKILGNHLGQAECQGNIGVAFEELGNDAKAIEHFEVSLYINLEIGNKSVAGTAHLHLGVIWARKQNLQLALAHFLRAEQCYTAIHHTSNLRYVYEFISEVYRRMGDLLRYKIYAEKLMDLDT